MAKLIRNWLLLVAVIHLQSCTKQEVIDTGVSSARFEGTVMDYLRSDDYNWKLTCELIEHAGLEALFAGKEVQYPEITFFGFTSQSVQRFLLESQYKDTSAGVFRQVSDLPVELARELVLRHVVAGRYLKVDFGFLDPAQPLNSPLQGGGKVMTTLAGNSIRAFCESSSYGSENTGGPVHMRLYSITARRRIPVASPDIQPDNGVVHALNYGYEFPVI